MENKARTQTNLIAALMLVRGYESIKANFKFETKEERSAIVRTLCRVIGVQLNEELVIEGKKRCRLQSAYAIIFDNLSSIEC